MTSVGLSGRDGLRVEFVEPIMVDGREGDYTEPSTEIGTFIIQRICEIENGP